jgi:uncharacterized Zn-binding protein involved in type VI secretion
MQAAARLNDPIAHTSALSGLIAGAIVGAGLALGAALLIGTAGLAAPLLIGGAMLAGGAMGAWGGEFIGSLSFFNDTTGNIATGSSDVFVNFKPLARAIADTGKCSRHGSEPPQIATGSGNVFINGFRAARVDDKLTCGSFIVEGSPDVFIGGGQVELKTVKPEVPWQVHALVMGAGVVGAVLLGGWAAIPGIVGGFAVGYVGGEVMGWVGRQAGDWLSENIGGKPSDWEKAGTFVGQALGGWLGAKGGSKAWGLAKRTGGEPNAPGMRDGNINTTPRIEPLRTTNPRRSALEVVETGANEAKPGPVNFMKQNDTFFRNASKRTDVDPNGYFDVIAHGSPNKIQVQTQKGPVLVNHRVAARLIKQSPGYSKGQNIRLLSCRTGAADKGFAQNLANKLGVEVKAPNDVLWAYPNGKMVVAPYAKNGGPNLNQQGAFRIFTPGKPK